MSSHGTLHVTVKELRGICNQQGPIVGDFHVEVYCDFDHKQRTKIAHGMCPKWDETFTFHLAPSQTFVAFAAYEEVHGKSVALGTATLQFQHIIDKPEDNTTIDLSHNGKSCGGLLVQLKIDK